MTSRSTHLARIATRILGELIEFCRIPSVSTDPAYADGHRARRRAGSPTQLRAAGLETVEIDPTGGHPVVYGEWLGAPGAPTVLVYGHYDVQPPDPLGQWTSPPFEPTVRDGRLYARGVSDDKGPMLIPIEVAEAFLATAGRPAGQRQVPDRGRGGDRQPPSRRLRRRASEELLAADVVRLGRRRDVARRRAVAHRREPRHLRRSSSRSPARPRTCTRAATAAASPTRCMRMAALIASLHDADGRVAVAGFYDRVAIRRPNERARHDRRAALRRAGLLRAGRRRAGLVGEAGYTTLERQWLRPTLEVNGMWGGYQGPGEDRDPERGPREDHLPPRARPGAGGDRGARGRAPEAPLPARPAPGGQARATARRPMRFPTTIRAWRWPKTCWRRSTASAPLSVRMGATVPIGLIFRNAIGARHGVLLLLDRRRGLPRAQRVLPPAAPPRRAQGLDPLLADPRRAGNEGAQRRPRRLAGRFAPPARFSQLDRVLHGENTASMSRVWWSASPGEACDLPANCRIASRFFAIAG